MAKSQLQHTNDIIAEIAARKFRPLYILHGEEDFFTDEIVEALEKNVLTPAEKEFNLTVVYGSEADGLAIVSAAKRFPMMSEYQLVIVKEAQNMKNIAAFENYVANPIKSTVLCLAFKGKKIDARTKAGKVLANAALLETKKLYDYHLPALIPEIASSMGIKLSPEAVLYITENLGTNPRLIKNELSKLMIGRTDFNFSLDIVKANIPAIREYSAFDLQAAIGRKDKGKVTGIAARIAQRSKNAPGDLIQICGSLNSFFQKVYLLHFKGGDAKAAGIPDFLLRDFQTAQRNYSPQKLEEIFSILQEYDFKAKGILGKNSDGDDLFTEMTYRIMN